jgi:hypothetical protein
MPADINFYSSLNEAMRTLEKLIFGGISTRSYIPNAGNDANLVLLYKYNQAH